MGKRELNKVRKREAIVEIATQAFLENGYAATSMSAIADTMGGSKATLWAHFSSKEDLFAAVVDGLVDRFSETVTETLVSQTFSLPAMRRACVRFLEALLLPSSVQFFRLVVAAGEGFPEVGEMFHSRGPAKIRRCMREFMETRLCVEDAHRLTALIVAALNGYRADILMRPDKPTRVERERFVDDLISAISWPDVGVSSAPDTL
ncbi:TetR/AcrR family transcriptional regulator [Novosphingobium sp. Rr 2-17]|uniref:TetR/AcrR family transcriptional regulator n=1 Tax=Novosphingobium sp. Rr 2-17 TaxID=555793 RepID=UPI0002F75872|nr:TetR/AcrR family transcriptional regulator [Novosphingobium sp. Rr 2-17]